jgi:putative endonuclease
LPALRKSQEGNQRPPGRPRPSALRGAIKKGFMPSFVYVLAARGSDGRIVTYVGWTLDLQRRLAEHNAGSKGARSTRGRLWALVYAEKHRTRRRAMSREANLKRDRAFRALLRQSLG